MTAVLHRQQQKPGDVCYLHPLKITAATRLETGTVKSLLLKSLDSQYPRGNGKQDENLEPLPSFCTHLIHIGS